MTIELSVVIPTYNRATRLRACLDALAHQIEPPDHFEVVVVDDGSSDGTAEAVAGMSVPFRLSVLRQQNAGAGAARNRGAAAALGRTCLFIDDDVVASPELVSAHLVAQRTHGGVVAIGPLTTVVASDAHWYARWHAADLNGHYSRLAAESRAPIWSDCYSGNLSLPRDVFLELGGFATDLPRGEDLELGYRLERHGVRFVHVADARGTQDERKTLHELARDLHRQGDASVRLWRRHPAMLSTLLGKFGERGARQRALIRLLLALDLPLAFVVRVIQLLPSAPGEHGREALIRQFSYWRGVAHALRGDRETLRALTHGVSILVYHAFGDAGEAPSRFVMPRTRFAWQMAWLRLSRRPVIGLRELVRCRLEHRLPPARAIVITIDDGFRDVMTIAWPILRRHGFPATLFMVTGLAGRANEWDAQGATAGRALLDWDDLRALRREGLEVGPHTGSHLALDAIEPAAARAEIKQSHRELVAQLGDAVPVIAYPFGRHDAVVEREAERAGMRAGLGVRPGENALRTSMFALQRTEIHGTDTLLDFARMLGTRDHARTAPAGATRLVAPVAAGGRDGP